MPSGLPGDWDKSIPLPPRATVAAVSDLRGVMRPIDFQIEGQSYSELKTFYTTELKAAGYDVQNPVAQPGQQTIGITFSACGRLDTVSIFPDQQIPKDFDLRIVYDTDRSSPKPDTSNSILGLYVDCSFGDADACNQLNSGSGAAAGTAEHNAMIQEQLKSPQQRSRDRERELYEP